jgi:polar amino acid transport system substrate-binding protein
MNKKWIFILALLGAALAMFLPTKQSEPTDFLIVGTNAEFAPFTFIENQHIVGFDIDIANEAATRLGKKLQIKDMPFDALISEVTMGSVQIVAAGMSYTEERAKRVLFTKPYLNGDPLVIVSKNEIPDIADLGGKTVVVNEGFTADLYMSQKPNITLIRLPTVSDGFMAIKCDRADAFVTAKSTVKQFLSIQKDDQFYITPIADSSETCALVISKKHKELLPDIQNALDAMEQDGTIDKLKAKWNLS